MSNSTACEPCLKTERNISYCKCGEELCPHSKPNHECGAKTDLTEFSDRELSIQVFNTEHLYRIRKVWPRLFTRLNELFIFSDEQLKELRADLQEEDE